MTAEEEDGFFRYYKIIYQLPEFIPSHNRTPFRTFKQTGGIHQLDTPLSLFTARVDKFRDMC